MFGFGKKKEKKNKESKKEKIIDYTKKVTSFDQVKENFEDIKDMYKKVGTISGENNSNNNVKKTFSQVARENKLNQEDIANLYNINTKNFYISVLFFIICLLFSFITAYNTAKIFPFLAGVAISFVFLANAFRYSITAFKIKYQKFCSFNDWYNNPNEWFPKIKIKK